MSKHINFFKAISSHNRERFHSECIAWILNLNLNLLRNLISDITSFKSSEINYCKAISEISQIDILIVFNVVDGWKFIHIENKIKSSEHEMTKSQVQKISNKDNSLSQSEYYRLRLEDASKYKHIISSINTFLENENLSNILPNLYNSLDWNFVFLRPSNLKVKEGGKMEMVYQPDFGWKLKSYSWLMNLMEKNELKDDSNFNMVFYDGYKEYLSQEFTTLTEFEYFNSMYCLIDGEPFLKQNNSSPSITLMNQALDWKPNIGTANLVNDHMLYIEKSIQKELSLLNDKIKVEFKTDSGNNSCYILEAYYVFDKNNFDKYIKDFGPIKIGFQFEQVRGNEFGRFKYFIAALEYDKKKFTKAQKDKELKQEFQKRAEHILRNSWGRDVVDNLSPYPFKINKNKVKTFFNFAIEISNNRTATDQNSQEGILFQLFRKAFENFNKNEIDALEKLCTKN